MHGSLLFKQISLWNYRINLLALYVKEDDSSTPQLIFPKLKFDNFYY